MSMKNMKVFVVFEPSNHMGRVVRVAHERGYHVLVLHHYSLTTMPPYGDDFKLIDQAVKIDSWADHQQVLELIKQLTAGREIVGTYAGFEFTLVIEATLRRELGLPHNPPQLLEQLLNKKTVRERLKADDLTDIKFYGRSEIEQWQQWPEGLKGFFKPAYGGGSCLVKRCCSLDDLDVARNMWQSKDEIKAFAPFKTYVEQGNNEYMVEQEIEGELLSVEGFSHQGQYHVIGISGRRRLVDDLSIEMADLFPYDVPFADELIDKVACIHKSLGIVYGATHTEMIVDGKGGAELVEVNIRFPGADLLVCMNISFDTRVEEIICDFACGNDIDLSPIAQPHCHVYLRYLLPPEGAETIARYEYPAAAVFTRQMLFVGSAVSEKRTQIGHSGAFIVTGQNAEQAEQNMHKALSQVKLDGQPFVMDKNNRIED